MSEAAQSVGLTHHQVVSRINALDRSQVSVGVLGTAFDYEIRALKVGRRTEGKRLILMTGGVHGDEPAGVEAVLKFLEGPVDAYLDDFFFNVIPCVNPSGLDLGTRENKAKQDINRGMSDDDVPESVILRKFIAGRRFDVFLIIMKITRRRVTIMYVAERENRLLGEQIVDAVKAIGQIDGDENTDQGLDLPISEGLFGIKPKWREQGWSAYAYFDHSSHVVLCETPSTAWDLDRRVRAHRIAQTITLDHYKADAR